MMMKKILFLLFCIAVYIPNATAETQTPGYACGSGLPFVWYKLEAPTKQDGSFDDKTLESYMNSDSTFYPQCTAYNCGGPASCPRCITPGDLQPNSSNTFIDHAIYVCLNKDTFSIDNASTSGNIDPKRYSDIKCKQNTIPFDPSTISPCAIFNIILDTANYETCGCNNDPKWGKCRDTQSTNHSTVAYNVEGWQQAGTDDRYPEKKYTCVYKRETSYVCNMGYGGTATGAESGCTACQQGQYKSFIGNASCDRCLTGTYQNQTGQDECQKCPDGQYQDERGQSSCKPCTGEKEYTNKDTDKDRCAQCKDGYRANEDHNDCIEDGDKSCPEGQWLNNKKCEDCPTHAYCPGGTERFQCINGFTEDSTNTACECGSNSFITMCQDVERCIACPSDDNVQQCGSGLPLQCKDKYSISYDDNCVATCEAQEVTCTQGSYKDDNGECQPCPKALQTYTDSALTDETKAQFTSDDGNSGGIKDCYLAPGKYYDESGEFELSVQCHL